MQRNRGDPHQLGVEETEPLVRGVAWPEARTRNSQSTGREHGVSFKTAPLCGGGHFLEAVLFKRISRLGISKTVTLKRFFVCVCIYIYIYKRQMEHLQPKKRSINEDVSPYLKMTLKPFLLGKIYTPEN